VSKGIATLAGAGIARYCTAVLWGAVTTLGGAVASAWLGHRMLAVFGRK
jgi:PiT family inorganic phosphate transporter